MMMASTNLRLHLLGISTRISVRYVILRMNISQHINRLLGHVTSTVRRKRSEDWEEFYLRMTKRGNDPETLIGCEGQFQTMRDWQFNLLRDVGIEPTDTLLDLGCGVLRGGIPFIEFLQSGNYYGMDLSITALLDAHRRVHSLGLGPKSPTLIQNDDLSFDEVSGLNADYLLSQSVWSHLPPSRVRMCLSNMKFALNDGATVIVTYNELDADQPRDIGYGVDWGYPSEWLSEHANQHGYVFNEHEPPNPHPNGQSVARLNI